MHKTDIKSKIMLSIIIPVYCVEDYLHQCVNSVLEQNMQSFEIILVNDGSPDNCPQICNSYAQKDKRVKVVNKKNGGLSDARNAGMAVAEGEYFVFLDGDDYILPGTLEKIESAIKKDNLPDVMFLYADNYFPGGRKEIYGKRFKREDFYSVNKKEVLNLLQRQAQFHVSAVVKAVRRSLLEEKNISFTKGILSEDVDYSIKLYLNAQSYSVAEFPYYCYRQNRPGSIMKQNPEKRLKDIIFIIEKWVELAENEYKSNAIDIYCFLYHQYFVALLLFNNVPNLEKHYKAKLKKYYWLLGYYKNYKARLLKIYCKIFGIKSTSKILSRLE